MFANTAKNLVRRGAALGTASPLSAMPTRAMSSAGLEGFGRHKFMGDVADEFLKPVGMSWADMEDGTWTKDPAKADKVSWGIN